MKKILFALLLFCQGALLTAQPPFPNVDTIYGRNPTFMYPRGWADPFDSIQPRPAFGYPMDVSIDNSFYGGGVPWPVQTPEIACKYYTDRPVKIIGAAASFFIEPVNRVEQPLLDYYVDTSIDSWMEYLRIYKHGNQTGSNIMEMVREKEVYARDVTRMMRSYKAPFSATLWENIDYRFWYFDTTTRDFDRYH